MCVRLHPDIIAAAEVNSAVRRIDLRSGLNSTDTDTGKNTNDRFMQNLNCVYISAGRCVEQQMLYKQQMGASSTFVGYGNNTWTKDDYKAYFEKKGQFFDLVDEDNLLYKVRIDELCCKSNLDGYNEKVVSVTGIVKSIRKNLLSMDFYSPRVLADMGLCMN